MTPIKWFTPIKIENLTKKLLHEQQFLCLGSCFANNFASLSSSSKIRASINPTGISYNPISIAKHLEYALHTDGDSILTAQKGQELYFHNDFHGQFNKDQEDDFLHGIQSAILHLHEKVKAVDVLVITFGTSLVHVEASTKSIVNNCHKRPAQDFEIKQLNPTEIVSVFSSVFDQLFTINPSLSVILTISPIRHIKSGLVENSLSKAVLRVAIDMIIAQFEKVAYFPAFEIMIDELRDYRFYKEDLVHPNPQSIDYILARFVDWAFSKESIEAIQLFSSLQSALDHKAIHPYSESNAKRLRLLQERIMAVSQNYSYVDLSKELQWVDAQISNL